MKQHMKIVISSIVGTCLLMVSLGVCANGGPISSWRFRNTGGIAPLQHNKIGLASEDLEIRLLPDGRRFEVFARYVLNNPGEGKDVKYAVPFAFDNGYFEGFVGPEAEEQKNSKARKSLLWRKSKRVRIDVNGVRYRCRPSSKYYESYAQYVQKTKQKFHTKTTVDSKVFEKLADWEDQGSTQFGVCVANIHVPHGEEVTLTLSYISDLVWLNEYYSNSPLVRFTNALLHYELFPAGFWHGRAKKVIIRLYPGLFAGQLKNVIPKPSMKQEEVLIWQFENIDLLETPILLAEVTTSQIQQSREFLNMNNYWPSPGRQTKMEITASSHDKSYPPSAAFDGKKETAWCVSSRAAQKQLRAKFALPYPVSTETVVAISQGFVDSESTYNAHGRPTKVSIRPCNKKRAKRKKLNWADAPLETRTRAIAHFYGDSADLCYELEILAFEKGSEHEDVCISEMVLVTDILSESKHGLN